MAENTLSPCPFCGIENLKKTSQPPPDLQAVLEAFHDDVHAGWLSGDDPSISDWNVFERISQMLGSDPLQTWLGRYAVKRCWVKLPDETLLEIAIRLQDHFDGKHGRGTVNVAIGDGCLYVYVATDEIKQILPAWMAEIGVPVEFIVAGPAQPLAESDNLQPTITQRDDGISISDDTPSEISMRQTTEDFAW